MNTGRHVMRQYSKIAILAVVAVVAVGGGRWPSPGAG
jgi:hypothetical protein